MCTYIYFFIVLTLLGGGVFIYIYVVHARHMYKERSGLCLLIELGGDHENKQTHTYIHMNIVSFICP